MTQVRSSVYPRGLIASCGGGNVMTRRKKKMMMKVFVNKQYSVELIIRNKLLFNK